MRKLLILRFGELPDAVMRRIESAGEQELDGWLDRVLAARSLDDVLTDGRGRAAETRR